MTKKLLLKFLTIFLLSIPFLYAEPYPQLFSQLGTPLFEDMKSFEILQDTEALLLQRQNIFSFQKKAKKLLKEGLEVDVSQDKSKIKQYLMSLRQLQKLHDGIEKSYKQSLYKSINDNNTSAFYSLMKGPLPFISSDTRLKKKVVHFYKKTKNKNNIYLENLSKDFKLDEKSYAYMDKMFQLHQQSMRVEVATSLSSFVPQEVYKNPVRVISIKTKTGFDLYVENSSFSDVTVKIVASKLLNLSASARLPYINSYPAKSRSKALHFSIIDPKKTSQFAMNYSSILGRMNPRYDKEYLYALPYKRGKGYKLSQGFNGAYTHKGGAAYALDFQMPIGTQVHAMRDGIVISTESKHTEHGFSPKYASKANHIIIEHSDGTMAMYGHLNTNGVRVSVGDRVYKHQLIGYSGNTGYSSGPHLHVHISVLKSFASGASSTRFRFLSKRGKIDAPIELSMYIAK